MSNQFNSKAEVEMAMDSDDKELALAASRLWLDKETLSTLPDSFEATPEVETTIVPETIVQEVDAPVMEQEAVEPQQEVETAPELDETLELQRRVHDQMVEQEREFKAQLARQEEETKKREEELLKRLNDVESKYSTTIEDYEDIDYDLGLEDDIETLEAKVSNEVSEGSSTNDIQKELNYLKQQIAEQKERQVFEDVISRYNRFWDSSQGKELRPEGNARDSINEFLNFQYNLSEKIGNEDQARRMMYDMVYYNGSISKDQIDRYGLDVPKNLDKMFKSLEVELYSEGKVIDPVSGAIKQKNANRLDNLEEAYILMNKNNPDAYKKAAQNVQRKMTQLSSRVPQTEPTDYRSFDTYTKSYDMDYHKDITKRAMAAGLKNPLRPDQIKDPVLRQEYKEHRANLERLKQTQ